MTPDEEGMESIIQLETMISQTISIAFLRSKPTSSCLPAFSFWICD
jgi:hypothetical protein